MQTINPLCRQASSLGLNLGSRLRRVFTGVILKHVKDDVVRVDNVAVLQQEELMSSWRHDNATRPVTRTSELILLTRQERVVVKRRELTKALSLLRREEQPIPVHVLRHIVNATARNRLKPTSFISSRRDLAKQAVRVVLRPIREDHLSTVVTSQISVDQRTVIVTTVNGSVGHRTPESTPELQRVVALTIDGGLSSLSDPLFLALFGHLALDPVLQRSLITVRPTTATDLLEPKINRSLLIDLVDRVVRQVGAVDLHARCRHVSTVHLVHQVRRKRTLSVEQVPEQLALDLT